MKVLLLAPADSPLLAWLEEQGEEVVQTMEPIDGAFVDRCAPGLLVSYGYQHILRADVLDRLPGAAINLHISLLPWNRGSDPNVWSFLEDTPKGVTIHHLDEGVDTGDVIAQREVPLGLDGTLRTTHAQLSRELEALFRDWWPAIREGRAPRRPQPPGGPPRRRAELAALGDLLWAGWDTPVADLAGRAPHRAGGA